MRVQTFITLLLAVVSLSGCSASGPSSKKDVSEPGRESADPAATTAGEPQFVPISELKSEDLKQGNGHGAQSGDMLTVLYEGTLTNGVIFDGNMTTPDYKVIPGKDPFAVELGMGRVIPGWDKGLIGVKVGGIRKLWIPSKLAYGSSSAGKIPPNSDLIFTIKCIDIVKKGEELVIDIQNIKPGSGVAVKNGDKVSVHYVGTLLTGKKFDSSRDRKQPFSFTVGKGEVVPGFDKGVVGMKKGGVRKLRIPPRAAYGASPMGGLPANSVLNFEIELLSINGK